MVETRSAPASGPHTIRMHALDNVAIVANDGGLAAGTVLVDKVPQCHKVALKDLAVGAPVLRYGIAIGYAVTAIAAGSWVRERLLTMPEARGLDGLPMATGQAAPQPALKGYTFEGYRNADGSVGTRNILAITQTVQCVAGVTGFAVRRIKAELLPRFAHVDEVWRWNTATAAAWRSTHRARKYRFARCAVSA